MVPIFRGQESDSWPLNMGPIGCPETSVIYYHYSLRNDPEERSSQTRYLFLNHRSAYYLTSDTCFGHSKARGNPADQCRQVVRSPGRQVVRSPGRQFVRSPGRQFVRSPGHQVARGWGWGGNTNSVPAEWSLLYFTLLASGILRWLLDFRKFCTSPQYHYIFFLWLLEF